MKVKIIHTAIVEMSQEAFERLQAGDSPETPVIDLLQESSIGKTEYADAMTLANAPIEDTWDDEYLKFPVSNPEDRDCDDREGK
jgi:hypothetical protein